MLLSSSLPSLRQLALLTSLSLLSACTHAGLVMPRPPGELAPESASGESYRAFEDNPFLAAAESPVSTFSVDVDTASYANLRRFLKGGRLPPRDAVRVEEMLNYFDYDYPEPEGDSLVAARIEAADAPWAEGHRLVRVALKAREIDEQSRPPMNLVFLVDVSGSMDDDNKLPLLKESLSLLTDRLRPEDKVSIVVYAGASGVVLSPTSGANKLWIKTALWRMSAGGSTNGAEGIRLAYRTAREGFLQGGVNRVVLATDGDFNVGITSYDELKALIEEEAETGVFLTVLGLGMGNYKDSSLEMIADNGNGNYAYLDSLDEAKKVLVDEHASTFVTLAKDVKLQVEWNRHLVESYRLIGYENRVLAEEDFDDDRKDAGDMGAGHRVTALYEVVPTAQVAPDAPLLSLKLRYKEPDGQESKLLTFEGYDDGKALSAASGDLRFAAGVAAFGLLLRDSPHKGAATYEMAKALVEGGVGDDTRGLRKELVGLVDAAMALSSR